MIALAVVVACGPHVDDEPDLTGVYTALPPNPGHDAATEIIRILPNGRALLESASCVEPGEPEESAWVQEGHKLRFFPLDGEERVLGELADEVVMEQLGCEMLRLSFALRSSPDVTRQADYYGYEPCFVDARPGTEGDEDPLCRTVRCDDLPDCEWAD